VRDSYLLAFVGQRLINVRYQAGQARLPARASIPVDLMAFKSPYDAADPEDAEWLRTWAETLDYVQEARDVSVAHGAAFLLVSLSDVWRVSDDGIGGLFESYPAMRELTWDFEQPERRLEAYSAAHGIAYLPLLPAFRDAKQRSGRPLHWAADGHWTPAGHQLAAELVLEELQGLGYLPPVQAR
jgi:hypothetical protein